MTILFQTDNVFYLPPDQPFRIYDLMDWRRIDIHVQSLQMSLRQEALSAAHERAHQALSTVGTMEDSDRAILAQRVESFLHSIPLSERPPASTLEIQKILEPMRGMFWARLSQGPMESFFPEDYLERPTDNAANSIVLSTIGSVVFDSLGGIECELPSENPHSFDFAMTGSYPVATSEPLPPDEPLPLLREYCGFKGSSNQGTLVTIDLEASIPEACLAAIPLRRLGETRYETLYLHLETLAGERLPIFPFRTEHQRRIAERLKQAGFAPTSKSKRFSVWERAQDTIQIYQLLEGKESEGVPILPSFCLATQADGSDGWEGRAALLEGVFL